MTSSLVGSARVEIVGDLAQFAQHAEQQIIDTLHQMGLAVDSHTGTVTSRFAEAGTHSGQAYSDAMGKAANVNLSKTANDAASSAASADGHFTTAGQHAGGAYVGGVEGEVRGASGRRLAAAGGAAGEGMATGLRQRVGEGVSKLRSTLSGQVGDMAKMALGAFAVSKVTDFFKESVQGFRDHQVALAQTAQVVKTTGMAAGLTATQLGTLSDNIEANTGVDGDNVLGAENMLLTFTGLHDAVGKGNDIFSQATQITTDMSVALGSDLKGQAIQVGKALNDPIHGVSALAKVGVSFTDQQKEQIKTMVGANNTMGAQKIILKELNKEFGGTAAATETPAQKMMVAFHGLQDQIGAVLLPLLNGVENVLANYVLPVISAMAGWVIKNAGALKVLALVLAPLLAGWLAWTIATKVQAAWTATMTAAQTAFNTVMDANPVMLIVVALVALAVALVTAYEKVGWFRELVDAVWGAIKTGWEALWGFVVAAWKDVGKPIFDVIRTVIAVWWNLVKLYFAAFVAVFHALWVTVSTIAGWLKTAFNAVRSAIGTAVNGITTAFHAVGTALAAVWNNTISPVVGWINRAIHSVYTTITGIAGAIGRAWSTIWNGLKTTVTNVVGEIGDIVSGIWDGVTSGFRAIVNGGIDIINSVIGGINHLIDGANEIPFVDISHIDKIPHFARGGDLQPGLNVVGDAGPEMIWNSGARSTVLTNADTTARGGVGDGPVYATLDDETLNLLLALAMRPQQLVLPNKQVLAQAVNDGQIGLARR